LYLINNYLYNQDKLFYKLGTSMRIVNKLLHYLNPSLRTDISERNSEKKEREDSTLLKITACIPMIGLITCMVQTDSLKKKLHELPLPKAIRPHPVMGKILDENASQELKEALCQRAAKLESINRDYTKATLVNYTLTIALVVYALAINVIPFILVGLVVGVLCLATAVTAIDLYLSHSQVRLYEEMGRGNA
jgi:hypothetical protein